MDINQRVAFGSFAASGALLGHRQRRNKEIESEGLFLERFAPLCAQRWWYNNNNARRRRPPPLVKCATPTLFHITSSRARLPDRRDGRVYKKKREMQYIIYPHTHTSTVMKQTASKINAQLPYSTPYLRKYKHVAFYFTLLKIMLPWLAYQ